MQARGLIRELSRRLPWGFAAAAAMAAGGGAAQQPDSTAAGASCETGRIGYVFIDNHSLFDTTEDLDPRFAWAYDLANSLHVRTRESFIRTELLFEEGDCLDPFLLDESERLLRTHGFLAQVDIFPVLQDDGSYHVIVDTQDEWSTGIDIRFDLEDGLRFEGISLKEKNLLGTGQEIRFFFLDRDVRRDYGVRYQTPQLIGTRWDLRLAGGRTRPGHFIEQEIAYPFVGEIGRWAFRQSFFREDRLFDYIVPSGEEFVDRRVLLPLRDQQLDLAFVRRLGQRGSLSMLGGGFSYQELEYPDPISEIRLSENRRFDDAETAPQELIDAVLPQRNRLRNVRLVALFGQRWIRWIQRRALDTFRGEQDIEIGVSADLTLGKSLPGLADDDDIAGTINLYSGAEAGPLLITGRLRADARHDLDAPGGGRLEDVLAEGEMITYLRPPGLDRHTLVLRATAAGGWRTTTPFQLTLGGNAFLRGHRRERFPGGRRAVFSFEDRIFFGWPLKDVMDVGATVFADVGRVWPGDVPLGIDSGWKGDVGAGLRINFPAGGRTTYRLDLAFPLEGGLEDVRLVITTGEILGLIRRFGDESVTRSRRPPVTANLFRFPER